jgi:hypothetical protein
MSFMKLKKIRKMILQEKYIDVEVNKINFDFTRWNKG